MTTCTREGCERPARCDQFCSSLCAKIHHGTIPFDPDASKKRRTRKRKYRRLRNALDVANAEGIELFENQDALPRRLPGSFESGKRR